MKNLTDKQRLTIQHVAAGMPYGEAGIQAGYSSRSAAQTVHRMIQKPPAQAYLEDLRQKSETSSVLSISERKEILSSIATMTTDDATPSEAIRAIAELNKMDGAYVPEKLDVNHGGGVLLIPAISPDDWEKSARESQAKLMADTIDV